MPDSSEINRLAPAESYIPKTPEDKANEWILDIEKGIGRITKMGESDNGIDTHRAVEGFIANMLFGDSLGPLYDSLKRVRSQKEISTNDRRIIGEDWQETWLKINKGFYKYEEYFPRYSRIRMKKIFKTYQQFVNNVAEGLEQSPKRILARGENLSRIFRDELTTTPPSVKRNIDYYLQVIEKTESS